MKKSNIYTIATLSFIIFSFYACGNLNNEITENDTTPPQSMVADAPSTLEKKITEGKLVYEKVCQACHQADGKGLPTSFPPLAKSDYLAADLNRAIEGVVNGLSGEITVNGEKYNQIMPKSELNDEEIAAAFTYVLNNFENKGGEVNAEQVKALRK